MGKQCDRTFKNVVHIVDSSIVRAQIQKESHGFGIFVANRMAEIQSRMDPIKRWWVDIKDNPADFTTRPVIPAHYITVLYGKRGLISCQINLRLGQSVNFVMRKYLIKWELL